MNKSTLALVALATLALGALIGAAVVKDSGDEPHHHAADDHDHADATNVAAGGDAPTIRFLGSDVVLTRDEFGTALPYMSGENFIAAATPWRQETISIVIEGDGSVEHKALMNQGDALSFHWSVDGGQAYYDMHAHDKVYEDEFFTRYDEGEGTAASGTIVAPYKGQHGWYWLNLEATPITITLNVAGFYDEIIEIDLAAEE